jgi:hypothetical protein
VSIARCGWVGSFPSTASHPFASSVAINALDEYALSPTTYAPAIHVGGSMGAVERAPVYR